MCLALARMFLTRPHAAVTLKPGQDRKVAAIRDAQGRRGFRVSSIQVKLISLNDFVLDVKTQVSMLLIPSFLIARKVIGVRVLLYFFHLNKFDYCRIQLQ